MFSNSLLALLTGCITELLLHGITLMNHPKIYDLQQQVSAPTLKSLSARPAEAAMSLDPAGQSSLQGVEFESVCGFALRQLRSHDTPGTVENVVQT